MLADPTQSADKKIGARFLNMATNDTMTIKKATEFFESLFDEVRMFESGQSAGRCPAGEPYFVLFGDVIHQEGAAIGGIARTNEEEAARDWLVAALQLWKLYGFPNILWWRSSPRFENGRVRARLAMTQKRSKG